MRVAINGFGRIGRAVFRILDQRTDIQVVAINDLFDPAALKYLLSFDTVMGRFKGPLELQDNHLKTAHSDVTMLAERDPDNLPWGDLNIDVVVESTGAFRAKAQLEKHLQAGAKRVILTVPAKDEIDYTVVLGVNDDGLTPQHRIVSNASCTTNCLAPMAKVLNDAFGIAEGVINTVHAYTNDQRLADVPHSDWRRSRAAAENIIPTSTGAAKAVGEVLPELKGKLDGIASRVPVPDGSVVDLAAELNQDVTVEDIHTAVKEACATEALHNILQFTDQPLVSSDIIGNPHSSIYDASFTQVVGKRYVKTLNWYDNEWGYSSRVCDLLARMASF
ncbi:type I glyceraldehyde-3-phosphate dehydrogenase [Exilibacterium tricleocarpae]|uniref:Glyceraldehyde-3-phosphate dehydrogenase n=1 Tax=Exilibacterium tricleocarpae TaxID=2591008 RepID=A0A545U898_9GAMM|nr:type I glyceraldehyde-3-phosphate dehydrogenase [Exilibacterium tricleocarpae]